MERAVMISEANLKAEENLRKEAEDKARRKAGMHYSRKKAIAAYQAEKRKAEKMLMFGGNPDSAKYLNENSMYEEDEEQGYSTNINV
jgi:hypothetical protein